MTFSNVNDAPVISSNAISIAEGATLVLGSGNINTTDPDNTPAQLTYTASGVTSGHFALASSPGTVITSFTQAQISAGLIVFVHNGGEAAPSYSLTVSDGALSSVASGSSVTFSNVNDAPVLVTNSISITEGATIAITTANLNSTDSDNTAAQIVYTVSGVTGGHFALASSPGTAITSFTQAQINAGLIVFVHNGGEAAPSYSVSLSDGTVSTPGSTVSGGTFTPVNDAPVVSGGLGNVTVNQGAANQTISLTSAFTDPDNPTLSYSAVSANGTLVGASISGSNLVLSFSGSLTGSTTVTVTATDAAGLFVSTTFTVTINGTTTQPGMTLSGGVLTITGTEGRDHVNVKYDEKKDELTVDLKLNQGGGCSNDEGEHIRQTFRASLVNRIVAWLFGGDDQYIGNNGGNNGSSDGAIPQYVFGGSGDDHLQGGRGNDVLSGGSGNDELFGRDGSDILIGGLGCDTLRGQDGDDILVANRVTFEADDVALQSVLAEWTSGRSFATRVANLRGTGSGTRLNGSTFLDSTTVLNDNAVDQLFGSNGQDWFLGTVGQDLFKDRNGNELIN